MLVFVREKLEVIREADEIGNHATGCKLDIRESCISDWRKRKEKLLMSNKNRKVFLSGMQKCPQIELLSSYI